ncbi:hypothetical protein BDV29DRAFT_142847 [Aspergillus leporis]|jgi:predicted dehydrogenase|uniref:Gfo/Idh/MocA-like oxidoreductase N-terminal domain-containing protein n=1 Tax=Aspergillus leporis TaxID=41062 RepID=A0A5N5WXG4_9EURO|nr:hypothetical protein BDV29DRAFT_142847 [Aspergillus leporis]
MGEPNPPTLADLTLSSPSPSPNRSPEPLRFLVIGAGSRGNAYAQAVTNVTSGVIHAIAEPHPFKRQEFGRNYIWGHTSHPQDGQEFNDWRDWLLWETKRREQIIRTTRTNNEPAIPGVDGVFICSLDETHAEIVQALAPLQLHILCEKPLALSLSDCLTVYRALLPENNKTEGVETAPPSTIFSIGHVLRYSPHNILLRKLLLQDRIIGDIVSLEHCEPVGWWHFAHSYVRGNWRRETPTGDGSLLTKSCHDLDFILWLLCSPPPLPLSDDNDEEGGGPRRTPLRLQQQPHLPRTITSSGSLTQFRRSRKPRNAGDATTCVTCPAEQECNYSALKIYRDMHVSRADYDWPVNIVCPDIEDVVRSSSSEQDQIQTAEKYLLSRLEENYGPDTPDEDIARRPWYGRCVYESDNNVCDDQVVTLSWDDEPVSPDDHDNNYYPRTSKTAIFHMIAPTEKQCERRGRVYGTQGEISYDSRNIDIYSFATRESRRIEVPKQPPEEEKSHGGGDYGLARAFVRAVDAVVNQGWEVERAQRCFVGCTLEEAVRSHAVVFAAEEARREEKVVRWKEWWEEKLLSSIGTRSACE